MRRVFSVLVVLTDDASLVSSKVGQLMVEVEFSWRIRRRESEGRS
jgi:hypothetical protein